MLSDPDSYAALRGSFLAKAALLDAEPGLLPWPAGPFYRDVFPVGSLQPGPEVRGDGRGHGIAVEVLGEVRTRRREDGEWSTERSGQTYVTTRSTGVSYERPASRRVYIDDDLAAVSSLAASSREHNSFVFASPVSYWGRARTAANARELYALVVDLDGVGIEECRALLAHARIDSGPVPPPSALVLSGTGLHVWYLLDRPVPLRPYAVPGLQELKRTLTDSVWNGDTSSLPDRQYQGIYQGFRLVGTQTRLNGAIGSPKISQPYEVAAWSYRGSIEDGPRRWPIDALVDYLYPRIGKRGRRAYEDIRVLLETGGRTPLEEARRKWPDWYERRVVQGQGRSGWVTNRAMYDRHLERIRAGAQVHHRYWCVYSLACLANKCGVGGDELERDALALMPILQARDIEGNSFSEADLYAALEAFDGGAADSPARRTTVDFVRRTTGLSIPQGPPRKGRTRAQALEVARLVQSMDDPDGWWRNEDGAPRKDLLVWSYAAEHPGASHAAIARALGISRTTVVKWLRVPDWRERLAAARPVASSSDPGVAAHRVRLPLEGSAAEMLTALAKYDTGIDFDAAARSLIRRVT